MYGVHACVHACVLASIHFQSSGVELSTSIKLRNRQQSDSSSESETSESSFTPGCTFFVVRRINGFS